MDNSFLKQRGTLGGGYRSPSPFLPSSLYPMYALMLTSADTDQVASSQ